MSVRTLVSAEEYLSSVYDPDVDYVNGELEDRCVGEKDHAKLQLRMVRLLEALNGNWFIAIETRIKVSPNRYRVPDVCVFLEEPQEQVFSEPPLLVVEVLSPEDRMSRMQRKLEDYYCMGCPNIWILDPWRQKAFQYNGTAMIEIQESLNVSGMLELSVSKVFSPK